MQLNFRKSRYRAIPNNAQASNGEQNAQSSAAGLHQLGGVNSPNMQAMGSSPPLLTNQVANTSNDGNKMNSRGNTRALPLQINNNL